MGPLAAKLYQNVNIVRMQSFRPKTHRLREIRVPNTITNVWYMTESEQMNCLKCKRNLMGLTRSNIETSSIPYDLRWKKKWLVKIGRIRLL